MKSYPTCGVFCDSEFGSYGFATGTPFDLVELLKDYDLDRFAYEETDAETLDRVDSVQVERYG